jgi:N-acetylneuraminic acid mutarotase
MVTVLATHEIFDPGVGHWSQAAPLPTPRTGLAAVTGRDGLIYAIGGANATTGLLKTVEVFDGNLWKPGPSLPVASYCLAAAVSRRGLIYAIGGIDTGFNVLSAVYGYDPAHPGQGCVPQHPLLTPQALLAADTGPDAIVLRVGGW